MAHIFVIEDNESTLNTSGLVLRATAASRWAALSRHLVLGAAGLRPSRIVLDSQASRMSTHRVSPLLNACVVALVTSAALAPAAFGQVVYHLHNEASTTTNFRQLNTAGPDVAQAVLQTAALQNVATGEKQIAQFDTATGIPGTAGRIPSGATINATVWMRKTANFGTMFPRVKVRLNSSAGTSLCTATGTTALTTILTSYTLTCTTTANVTLTATDRLYVWAGVNLTVGSNGGAFRGELGLEGTLNGTADSFVSVPTALPAPAITAINPPAGPIGTVVTITGNNFRDQQLASTVRFFNNRTATITSWSNTSIVATVPASSVTGNVTVTVAGLASPGLSFGVGNVPSITQLSSGAGIEGTTVTITGSNFGATKGTSTVKFNGVTAATTSWSAISVTATVPAGATTGNVVVTVANIASPGVLFTVPTLTSMSVTPSMLTVPIDGVQQFRAIGQYSDGIARDASALATWTTDPAYVASVTSTGLVTVDADAGTTTISATLGTSGANAQLNAAPSRFQRVGVLNRARPGTATLLNDGRVLVTDSYGYAELYDPATGRFQLTGAMQRQRLDHTATKLPDGKVLIAGGHRYNPDQVHNTSEIYDPATGLFTLAATMSTPLFWHNATLLNDGRVLIEGGYTGSDFNLTSEIYDPATGSFTTTGNANAGRLTHTSTLLSDGRVLVAGGYNNGATTAVTELYDPATGVFATNPSLTLPRIRHTATRLGDGRVLFIGGGDECPNACSAEFFDPTTLTFAAATGIPSVSRASHSATLLNDGTVLVAGGYVDDATGTAEIFDPATQTFVAAGAMTVPRSGNEATKLLDGNVLIVGGASGAELYITTPIAVTSLSISPSSAILQVGESRTFTLVDQITNRRNDAQWSSSDPNVATVDPVTGLVTAIAPGSVIVTGSIGLVSADVPVTVVAAGSLPAGAPRWTITAPLVGGFTTKKMLQSTAPDERSPAVFAIHQSTNETLIQALTSSGGLMWEFLLPADASNFVPNKSGGLLVTLDKACDSVNPTRLLSIDGPTGMWAWEFVGATTCGTETPGVAIRPDGAVAVATAGNLSGFPGLMILDGDKGTVIAAPAIPGSSYQDPGGTWIAGYSRVGPAMVDRDGVVQLLYELRVVRYPPEVFLTRIFLMRVYPSGVVISTQLSADTDHTNLFPGNIIPDGQGGLIATWIDSPIVPINDPPAQSTIRAARVTSGGAVNTYDLPLAPPADLPEQPDSGLPINPEMTLGETGRAFVTYEGTLVAFDVATGGLIWQYEAPSGTMRMIVSDDADGIVAANTVAGVDTVRYFNSSGGMTTIPITGASVEYTSGGGWIGVGAVPSEGGLVFMGTVIDISLNGWSSPTQQKTKLAGPLLKLIGPSRNDPQQSVIRSVLEMADTLLLQDANESNNACSTWFNTAFPLPLLPNAAAYIEDVLLQDPPNSQFAHATFEEGGSVKAGERTAAVVGTVNTYDPSVSLGGLPGTIVNFNRDSVFFTTKGKFAGYPAGKVHAQLTIALHELAHLLQILNPATVAGFTKDGGDPTGQASLKNTNLLLKHCKTMINRIQLPTP
jgi:hypothetical protein